MDDVRGSAHLFEGGGEYFGGGWVEGWEYDFPQAQCGGTGWCLDV